MLYTPVAVEDIFATIPDAQALSERWVHGRLCLVRLGKDGMPRLERLISTDPDDYLDPAFQPNAIVWG
ncbi:MAG: hypothetical protein C7B45_01910 [Sulfobacillus acidophilus]|uniref:Uncharacterized protein n=1 Tax=Sulfobacillus acidophilus TaxID=53633 RepID=A0A2T2WNH5_9FIRM|nr:MAG: hypothetical protein C7B45_01910 [Sulfobacillus acidophilus]